MTYKQPWRHHCWQGIPFGPTTRTGVVSFIALSRNNDFACAIQHPHATRKHTTVALTPSTQTSLCVAKQSIQKRVHYRYVTVRFLLPHANSHEYLQIQDAWQKTAQSIMLYSASMELWSSINSYWHCRQVISLIVHQNSHDTQAIVVLNLSYYDFPNRIQTIHLADFALPWCDIRIDFMRGRSVSHIPLHVCTWGLLLRFWAQRAADALISVNKNYSSSSTDHPYIDEDNIDPSKCLSFRHTVAYPWHWTWLRWTKITHFQCHLATFRRVKYCLPLVLLVAWFPI
jgi:hypothetical protein